MLPETRNNHSIYQFTLYSLLLELQLCLRRECRGARALADSHLFCWARGRRSSGDARRRTGSLRRRVTALKRRGRRLHPARNNGSDKASRTTAKGGGMRSRSLPDYGFVALGPHSLSLVSYVFIIRRSL